jgi:outer membrane protein TolC
VDVTTLPPETPPEQIQQIMIQNQIAQAYLILQQTFLQLYGISSPSLTSEQIYDNFIFTMDVLPLQLIGQMNNLRIDRQRAVASIKNGVETMWWNLGSLRNQKLLTENYAELVGIQLTTVQNKYNLGQAAEIELSTKKHELDSAKTNDLRLEREVENLEYRLRSLAGLDFSEPFSVSISPGNTVTQKLLTFEDYQRLAVRTRVDAIKAQQTLDTIRHEESVMSGYITIENHIRRREIRLKRLEAEQALSSLKRDLAAQVFELYHDAMTAKEAFDTASSSLQLAMLERNRYKALFDQGYLSRVDYEGTQMVLTQAYIQYESAKYQYAMKLQQLNHAVIYGGSTGGAFQ